MNGVLRACTYIQIARGKRREKSQYFRQKRTEANWHEGVCVEGSMDLLISIMHMRRGLTCSTVVCVHTYTWFQPVYPPLLLSGILAGIQINLTIAWCKRQKGNPCPGERLSRIGRSHDGRRGRVSVSMWTHTPGIVPSFRMHDFTISNFACAFCSELQQQPICVRVCTVCVSVCVSVRTQAGLKMDLRISVCMCHSHDMYVCVYTQSTC